MSDDSLQTASIAHARKKNASLSEVAIIIPAYNEQEAIAPTLETLRAICPEAEIIVVNDGSTDDTLSHALSVQGVTVLSHPRNRGYGASIKTALRATQKPYVVWFDADGQHRAEDLVSVLSLLVDSDYDLVIGARGKESARQVNRAMGKAVLNWVCQFIGGEKLPDLNSGLRAFKRDIILPYLHLLPDGFSASTTSTLLMLKLGFRVGYVPIVALERKGISQVKFWKDGFGTFQLIVRVIVLFDAFRVFSILGGLLILPGLLYGFSIALIRGEGFPALGGTAIIAGVLTFFMGVIADQVSQLRKERFENVHADYKTELPSASRENARR